MKFQLNDKDKIGMLLVDSYVWTYDNPGPIEVDIETISKECLNQIYYNCRRGVLACENPNKLIQTIEFRLAPPQPTQKTFSTPHENPIKNTVKIEDVITKDLTSLRKLLCKSVSSIKKELPSLSPGKIRKLLELEQKDKNRKSLIESLELFLEKHIKDVSSNVGDKGVEGQIYAPGFEANSPNITDIVESIVGQVTINPKEESLK